MKRFQQPKTPYLPTLGFFGPPRSLGEEVWPGWATWGEQDKEDLNRVCNLLNSAEKPELRAHLRELVKGWQDSGPNLKRMMGGSHKHLLAHFQKLFAVSWMPTDGGRATLAVHLDANRLAASVGLNRAFRKGPDGAVLLTPDAEAWVEFGFFTLNPHCEELAGPCARCGNYYVKKRASQKIYCSRRCGNAATAVARTRERIASERRDKLARAKSAMKKWESATTRKDWKDWVTQKTGIDPRFLTRAVTKGDLVPPKKGK